MDFDDAKENIQPLAQGRNASILQASLKLDSPQELLARRKELEKEIFNYIGDDPLSVWYNYIEWIEQSFPSGGKESGLQEVLSKCLSLFEHDERYKQDRRMIKLYIKFIDGYKDPAECYHQLYNAGIGTMIADFYIAWAYCNDLVGNTRKADEIFLRGIACRAQPLEELQEARQHFGFLVAQRLLYKDDDPIREETNRQLHERRMTLTSLRTFGRKKNVGSIRTGSAVKNVSPGTVKIDAPSTSGQRSNTRVKIFNDENENRCDITAPLIDSTFRNEESKSVVRSIIDATRNQENQKEPGPWNKANTCKKTKLFSKSAINNELGFEIHEDGLDHSFENIKIPTANNEIKFDKPFIYTENFCANSKPIKGWLIPVTTEEIPCKNTIPAYNKCKLYPRPNVEFQPEEIKAYNILKARNIKNVFTKERDVYWGCGPKYNIRLYPHFATQSNPQKMDWMDQFFIPEKVEGFKIAFDEIYNKEDNIERQFEEIYASYIKRNETIMKTTDMDETLCITSDKVQRRKSFFPIRKSLAPSKFKDLNKMDIVQVQNEKHEKYEKLNLSELSSKALTCSAGTKVADDDTKGVILNKCESQSVEIPQTLRIDTTYSNTISVAAEIMRKNEEESPKLLEKKQNENEFQSNAVNKEPVAEGLSSKPFEIFIDAGETKLSPLTSISNVPEENNFQFKTPPLPVANFTLGPAVSSKLSFEIFDDENLVKTNASSLPKPDWNCAGGFFDPEETCSTQTFNIFLKAQSASTPNAATKLQPQRQFGNILKEVTVPSVPELKNDHNLASPPGNQNHTGGARAIAGYSLPQQQLSTILETSEHGSTQGTHNTGATTKSTLSSPEFDTESQVQTTNIGNNQPHAILETVKELSSETSVIADDMMNSLKIQNVININTKTTENNLQTPGDLRLQYRNSDGGLNFSIFEDSIKTNQKQVGNFSRLEEKEDTSSGSVFRALPPIRFQEDKTETIPKMLITSQQDKFQDDKTEQISKFIFDPLMSDRTETETISKFILPPPEPEPTKFEDDDMELIVTNKEKNLRQEYINQHDTFEFFRQTPPKPAKLLIPKQTERGLLSCMRPAADSQTPLTCHRKRFCNKDITELPKSISKPTVLLEDELQDNIKNKHSPNLKPTIKDSFLPNFSLIKTSQNKVQPKSKSVLRDSFIPDFSIIEDSQPQNKQEQSKRQCKITESILPAFSIIKNTQPTSIMSVQTNAINVPETQHNESIIKSKLVFKDSIIPDFSIIEDSQPQNKQVQSGRQCKLTESILPEFSIIKNTQPTSIMSVQTNAINVPETQPNESIIKSKFVFKDSIIPDFSIIEDSQPQNKQVQSGRQCKLTESILPEFSTIKNNQPTSIMSVQTNALNVPETQPNESITKLLSVQKNFSKQEVKENYVDDNINCRQSSNPSGVSNKPKKDTIFKNILMDTFMKGFSEIKEPPHVSKEFKEITLVEPSKTSSLKFLNESKQHNSAYARNIQENIISSSKSSSKEKKNLTNDGKYFEFNCETEMFAPNISMIKNSTWLPNHGPSVFGTDKQLLQIQEKSLHIKDEQVSLKSQPSLSSIKNYQQVFKPEDSTKPNQNFVEERSLPNNDFSIELSASELVRINEKYLPNQSSHQKDDDDCENSIYYKQIQKTPIPQIHIWDDADALSDQNVYIHTETDLNLTHQVIENICIDPNVNPFNVDLLNAFLEQHDVISFVESLPTCKLVGYIQRIKQNTTININGIIFNVIKLIGEGAYGAVYCGKEASTGKLLAMKQEKPPNFWEYYICLEVQERIRSDEMLQSYMSVDYALIGNNASILISNFSEYGSLIAVANKIKKCTLKNVDEYVVMLLASELLEIIDHLHAVNIIHADVKADNFLLMNKLTYPPTERHLQLIDFGVSIDMKLFKPGQIFSFVHNDNSFKCPEMRDRRRWTYQLDLYGLAGVFHVLLFGKYMDIEKKTRGFWMHKTHVPRYLNKNLWDEIFKTLLNVRDCNSMPNLQDLRALLKREMEEKDKYVLKMVNEFNRALTN